MPIDISRERTMPTGTSAEKELMQFGISSARSFAYFNETSTTNQWVII